MLVSEFCNREVVVIGTGASVLEATELMRTHHVGDVVVVTTDERGYRRPVGVLTDRDIVVELVAQKVALDAVSIEDVMSFDLLTVCEDDDIFQVVKRMRGKGVRRTPVVDRDGKLVGLVAVDDVLALLAELVVDISRLIAREQIRERVLRT